MANIYGGNYTKEFINEPSEAANVGEYSGKQRVAIDSFSGAGASDVVTFALLPPNAFILAVTVIGGGTAPTFTGTDEDGAVTIAAGEKLGKFTTIDCNLDADTSAAGKMWIEYSLD
jgi:hypothetical protein